MAKDARKENLKRTFGSLINNACAVDGAKYSPWWIGLIMFILGLLLPILPLFVTSAKTQGVSFMANYEYGLGMDKTFGEAINNIDGLLTFNNSDKTIDFTPSSTFTASESDMIGSYVATSGTTNGQYDLRIYYSDTTDANVMSAFVTAKESIKYIKGTTTVAQDGETNVYTPSSIYFFKSSFTMDIYASNTIDKKALMSNLADLNCLDYSDNAGDLKAYFVGTSFDKTNRDNRLNSVKNLKEFINITYESTRTKSMWIGSLIYLGVYFGMNFFMVLMIFLMSRGKNNPNRVLNFWHCIKIDWWQCFCPGLLGMIFGFIFPAQATMFYVMFLALRTMWLTMRELKPQY